MLASLTQTIDPDAITVGWLDMGFEFVFKFNTFCLRYVNLKDTVLSPRTMPLERSIHSPAVRVLTYVVGDRQVHGHFENVNA